MTALADALEVALRVAGALDQVGADYFIGAVDSSGSSLLEASVGEVYAVEYRDYAPRRAC